MPFVTGLPFLSSTTVKFLNLSSFLASVFFWLVSSVLADSRSDTAVLYCERATRYHPTIAHATTTTVTTRINSNEVLCPDFPIAFCAAIKSMFLFLFAIIHLVI